MSLEPWQKMIVKAMAVQQAFAKPNKKERKAKRQAERKARMELLNEIREQVFRRSGGHCENPMCQRKLTIQTGGEFDHWLGGNGRRQQQESVETVWLLCHDCHVQRTTNMPTSAAWNLRFELHCERYEYPCQPHIVHT